MILPDIDINTHIDIKIDVNAIEAIKWKLEKRRG